MHPVKAQSTCPVAPAETTNVVKPTKACGAFRAFTGNDQACSRKPEMLTTKDQHTLLSRGFQAAPCPYGAMARRVSLQIFARFSQVPPTCLHYCKEKRHLFSPVFSFIWRRMSADRHRPKALCPYRTLVGVLLLCILAARFKGGCSGGM